MIFSTSKGNIFKDRTNFLQFINQEFCPICRNLLLNVNNYKVITRCGHIYCLSCLYPLLKKYLIFRINIYNGYKLSEEEETHNSFNKCPVCRKDMLIIPFPKGIPMRHKILNCRDITMDSAKFVFFEIYNYSNLKFMFSIYCAENPIILSTVVM